VFFLIYRLQRIGHRNSVLVFPEHQRQ
jgi:hypothetical protein